MIKTIIKIFGLPKELGFVCQVEVLLKEKAGMTEVIEALRQAAPELESIVIRKDEERLQKFYKFNINGRFFFNGMNFELQEGDEIALLIPATGG